MEEQAVIHVSTLLTIWKFSGVLWILLCIFGFISFIQEGGSQKGSEVWGPFSLIMLVVWVGFFIIKGIAF